jgi:hypothetical protein
MVIKNLREKKMIKRSDRESEREEEKEKERGREREKKEKARDREKYRIIGTRVRNFFVGVNCSSLSICSQKVSLLYFCFV